MLPAFVWDLNFMNKHFLIINKLYLLTRLIFGGNSSNKNCTLNLQMCYEVMEYNTTTEKTKR